MRPSGTFLVGTIFGGIVVWLWGKEIATYVGNQAPSIRATAEAAMDAVDETTGQALDGGRNTLGRAGSLLDDARERLSGALRAGRDAIRPGGA